VQADKPASLRRATELITIGGCMWVIYNVCVASPIAIDFLRALGAEDYHIAYITGVPMLMLAVFFIAAHLANRMRSRKPAFMFLFITARLLYLPVAFLPAVFPSLSVEAMMLAITLLIAANCGLSNFGETLFLSWMADLIPRGILNRFWGGRQRLMSLIRLPGIVGVALFVQMVDWPVTTKFQLLTAIGVVLGITDILLFLGVREPAHAVVIDRHPLALLVEPLCDSRYRSFLVFLVCWTSSAMVAGTFTTYYMLEVLSLPLSHVMLVPAFAAVGLTLTGRMWGRLADRHGHRPVLAACLALKPLFPLGMLLITHGSAYWILPLLLPFDGMLNAGLMVAQNGFTMKMAPRENRSMYLACAQGLPGIAAGLTAFAVGGLAVLLKGWSADLGGRTWNKYQLIFAISVVLRICCLLAVRAIHEPESSRTNHMLRDIMRARPWGRKP